MLFFMLFHFSLIAIDSLETLDLSLGLVEMHSAAASTLDSKKVSIFVIQKHKKKNIILYSTNIIGRHMNPSMHPPGMGK